MSSGVGFLALFGVSVQVGVIMLEYMNQLRARGHGIEDAAMEGAVLRLMKRDVQEARAAWAVTYVLVARRAGAGAA